MLEIDDAEAVRRGMQVYNHADLGRCAAAIDALAWFAEQVKVGVIVTIPAPTRWNPEVEPPYATPHSFFAAVAVPR